MSILRKAHIMLLFASLILFGSNASAMFIDRAIVNFTAEGPAREDVTVTNDSEDTIYVKIEILDVINPGTENEERKPVANLSESKLLATPSKLVIPPNGKKVVRLVNRAGKTNDKEHVYRVNVTPILPPLATEEENNQVRIVVAYQILVFLAPVNGAPNIEAKREGNMVTLTNTGNSYGLLTNGQQCLNNAKGEELAECKELGTKRLYPGGSWTTQLPYNTGFEFNLQSVNGNEKKIFQ